jgi:large subunit ribosomal protein L10
MSIGRTRKEKFLAELSEKLGPSGSIVLTDFTGIDVAGMTRLRNELRKSGIGFRVVKNTVLKRALTDISVADDAGVRTLAQGPTAVAWAADEILPVRVLKKFAKENDGRPSIKGGLVSGQSLSSAQMLDLAELPGREVLIARIMGSMNSPLQGFVNVTGAVLRSFLFAVKALQDQREQQG